MIALAIVTGWLAGSALTGYVMGRVFGEPDNDRMSNAITACLFIWPIALAIALTEAAIKAGAKESP